MGVQVDQIDAPFEAELTDVSKTRRARERPFRTRPGWAYLDRARVERRVPGGGAASGGKGPGLSGGEAVRRRRRGPSRRARGSFRHRRRATRARRPAIAGTGLRVAAADGPVAVDAFRLKPDTRIGLWRGAGNVPGGWLKWLFEQYGFNYRQVASADVDDLAALYDTIVLPDLTTRDTIVRGLDPRLNDSTWAWAYGVGDAGWKKLGDWVRNGGTLVAIGSAVDTARELLDLPIEKVWRERDPPIPTGRVFYCPGSLLQNDFDTAQSGRVRHARGLARASRGRPRLRLKPGSHDSGRGRGAVPEGRAHSPERLAARGGSASRPAERCRLPCGKGICRDDGQPGGFPGAGAGDLQAAVQRDLPRAVDARDSRGAREDARRVVAGLAGPA